MVAWRVINVSPPSAPQRAMLILTRPRQVVGPLLPPCFIQQFKLPALAFLATPMISVTIS